MIRCSTMQAEAGLVPEGATLVVAHPDDECLWLSSVLPTARHVVFVFGDSFTRPQRAAARRRAVAALHPLGHPPGHLPGHLPGLVNLAIPESGAGFKVDWADEHLDTALTRFGIAINEPAARARYEANFDRVLTALRPHLTGALHVCTHNPWGEYGHAEHFQVHRAVMQLQAELGFTVWYSNYVDARSLTLAARIGASPCYAQRRTVPTAPGVARGLMRVYRRHGAWTWTRWHVWPERETLFSVPPEGCLSTLAGEALLDVAGLRLWPPPWRRALRVLPVQPPLSSLFRPPVAGQA
ncbi:hypothetical protein [Granulibacter bethesdensis]|nr:hypothetical protein [Granulibacter bethesdensis]